MKPSACRSCSKSFSVSEEEMEFLKRVSPRIKDKLYEIPPPQLCPDCRQQRRLSFNNEYRFYHRKCDATGTAIISLYSGEKPCTVYRPEYYWGDEWDALAYGREFDFDRPFFEQFAELLQIVPKVALHTNYMMDENCAYTNYSGYNKNCYLIFHADYNRDCYYGYGVKHCESCVDVVNAFHCELCYECIDCRQSYQLRYSQDCQGCSDSAFLRDCIGCRHCFGCKNLRQREYCVFNKQLTKQGYEQFLTENPLSSRRIVEQRAQEFEALCAALPQRFLRRYQTENCFGDHLTQCRDVLDSYDISELHAGRHCYQIYNGAKDCMDLYQFGLKAELVYEGSIIGYNAALVRFCHCCNDQIYDLLYCMNCYRGKSYFGCVGVRGKEFCILNKQYSKDEYEALLPKIIAHMQRTGEWGEFFPAHLSPFGYNETRAPDFYALTREQALKRRLSWREDEEPGFYLGPRYEIADDIREVGEEVCAKVLSCERSGRSYKVIPPELQYYKKWGIPLPVSSPDERYRARMAKRRKRSIHEAACTKCGDAVLTSCSAENKAPVYCERCYQGELG